MTSGGPKIEPGVWLGKGTAVDEPGKTGMMGGGA